MSHWGHIGTLKLPTLVRVGVAVLAGVGIGIVAALMGVALIPTIVLLFGVGIKVAGSLSLVVSLPTMLVAFARYSRDQSFQILRGNIRFVPVMAAGSIAGTVMGGLLLGVVPRHRRHRTRSRVRSPRSPRPVRALIGPLTVAAVLALTGGNYGPPSAFSRCPGRW